MSMLANKTRLGSQCPAGEGPNDDYTGCDACLGVFYSPFGVCQECLPPAVPIMGNTFCSETVCRQDVPACLFVRPEFCLLTMC